MDWFNFYRTMVVKQLNNQNIDYKTLIFHKISTISQLTFTYLKTTIETLPIGVKYVQS